MKQKAVGQKFTEPAQVLLSQGNGTFTLQPDTVVDDVSDVVLADFNGDGEIDIVAGNRFYRGLPGGKFELVRNEGLAAGGVQSFGGAIAADFNGDGKPDLLAPIRSSSFNTQTLGIFTNKADGTFGLYASTTVPQSSNRSPIGVADLNGDKQLDLLFEAGEGSDIPYYAYVLVREPGGSFLISPSVNGLGNLGLNELSVLADLNSDGIPDPISYFRNPNPGQAVAVLPSKSGGFGIVTTNQLGIDAPNFFIRAIGAGDFDGDGKVDVVVSQADYPFGAAADKVVYFMRGNGDGILQKGKPVAGAQSLVGVVDLTGDGKPDLLTLQGEAGFGVVLAVLPGNGDGTFGAPMITHEKSFSFLGPILVGDFNGDGKPDFCARSTSEIGIWINDGLGRFKLGSKSALPSNQWELQALGEFNRDGKLDVLVNDRSGDIPNYKLIVLPGDGTGKLGAPLAPTPFPGTYNSIAQVVDINGDGAVDVVTVGRFPNQLQEARVSLGNGDGTFQPPISYFGSVGSAAGVVRAADFNHDGRIDLLIGESLLLQKAPSKP